MSKVKVRKFNDGQLSKQKEGSEYQSILLETQAIQVGANGFPVLVKRVAAWSGKADMFAALDLKEGDDINAKLASFGGAQIGIYKKETSEPAYEDHQPKINPTTQEIVKDAEGNPIYLQFLVLPQGSKDELIATGSTEAAVAATQEEREEGDVA